MKIGKHYEKFNIYVVTEFHVNRYIKRMQIGGRLLKKVLETGRFTV